MSSRPLPPAREEAYLSPRHLALESLGHEGFPVPGRHLEEGKDPQWRPPAQKGSTQPAEMLL